MSAKERCSKCWHPSETWRKDGSVIVMCHGCRRIEGKGPHAELALEQFKREIPGAHLFVAEVLRPS